MTLDIYFARRFLQSFVLIGTIFLTLMMLIDLIEQIRRFSDNDIGMWTLFAMVILNAPGAIKEILPLLMILATVLLFVGLARSSELVATRATGRSGIRALAAPSVMALLIGVLAVTTLGPIAAATADRYQALSDTYRTGAPQTFSISPEGVWLRQGGAQGQSVIHAASYGTGATPTLYDVNITTYAPQGGPIRRISAQSAELTAGYWRLSDAKAWQLAAGLNPERGSIVHDTLLLETTLTAERIRDSIGSPTGISIYDLPDAIEALEQAGFSTLKHRVWYQVELARPLFLLAMVLVGAAFTMRHARFGGTGISVLTAVLLGFALYFIRNFAQILGENGQLPIVMAAWGPPVASICLTFGLLLHAEDG